MKSYAFLLACLLWACGDDDEPSLPGDEGNNGQQETLSDGFNFSPEKPNADQSLEISFKAASSSALYGYGGDVYLHAGVVAEGQWMYVPAGWDENIAKCRMEKKEENVWSITLSPSVREWFGSGTTPVERLGLVIRSAEGDKKGLEEDTFLEVQDDKYTGFTPGEVKYESMPAGVLPGINAGKDGASATLVLYDRDLNGGRKDYAYVTGDFNNWTLGNTEASQMYRDEAAGCWWITVGGLDPAKEYAFQYVVGTEAGGSMRLADAYSEKILDPDNDGYIAPSTYPADGRVYPEQGIGIVSTFKLQEDAYDWSPFEPDDPDNWVIYELHFRDFSETGDINGAMEKLDYLAGLGINAIELMPVQEFDGNDSWGYNPCFYFALDKAYGTKRMYKDFIDACHKKGIAVLFDVVYNHATGNHPFARLYWDAANNKTAANNPWFNVDSPHPYGVFHDFNHESPLVKEFVSRNLQFLLKEYDIDGFRFDLAKGFTNTSSNESTAGHYDPARIDILKGYYAAIQEAKPGAVVILEHFCDDDEERELAGAGMRVWRNLNNAYCQSGMGWQEDSGFTALYTGTNDMPFGGYVGYMESHDEERVGYKMTQWSNGGFASDAGAFASSLTANAAFFFTVPGPKMLWQFGEMGYDVSIEENGRTGRKPLHWEYATERKPLVDNYARLISLRTGNPDLFGENASFSWKASAGDWEDGRYLTLYSITKHLVAVANFTGEEKTYAVQLPVEGPWYDYLSGEELEGNAAERSVTLPPHSAVVYTTFQ